MSPCGYCHIVTAAQIITSCTGRPTTCYNTGHCSTIYIVHPPTTKRNTHTLCTPLYQLINDHLINGRLINGSIMIGAIWLPTSLHLWSFWRSYLYFWTLLEMTISWMVFSNYNNNNSQITIGPIWLPIGPLPQCPLEARFCSQKTFPMFAENMSINRVDLKTLTDCKNVSSKMVKRHSMCYSALLPPRWETYGTQTRLSPNFVGD